VPDSTIDADDRAYIAASYPISLTGIQFVNQTANVSLTVDVTSGDKFRVRVKKTIDADLARTVPNASGIFIRKES